MPAPQRTSFWVESFLTLLAFYGALVIFTLLLAPLRFLPAEDVVILHSYSRNLADTGVISFYAGGPHAEGATDFGWMVLLAAGLRIGLAPVWVTAFVNALCPPVLGWLLCGLAGVRRSWRSVGALCGAMGLLPQILAVLSGFTVLPFAVLLLALVQACLRRQRAASALFALLLCLFRPDGLLFAVPLLVWLLFQAGQQRARASGIMLLLFAVPGLLYFFWRWHYFGNLLPLPFQVKADTPRVLGVFVPQSILASVRYLLPLFAILVTTGSPRRVQRPLFLCLVFVPVLFYGSMRLDQDVGDRFFFFLPLATAVLLARSWLQLGAQRRQALVSTACLSYLLCLFGPFLREVRTFRDFQFRTVQQVAKDLHRLPMRGTMLTTEAGFLPFASQWVAYDAWGLNTAPFAHRLIQPADVLELHPDMVVVHVPRGSSCETPHTAPQMQRTWKHMVDNVLLGVAAAHTYDTWQLSYGSEFYRRRNGWAYGQGDAECFFVDRQSPLGPSLADILQAHHGVLVSFRQSPHSVRLVP